MKVEPFQLPSGQPHPSGRLELGGLRACNTSSTKLTDGAAVVGGELLVGTSVVGLPVGTSVVAANHTIVKTLKGTFF